MVLLWSNDGREGVPLPLQVQTPMGERVALSPSATRLVGKDLLQSEVQRVA